jgi:hypothetical protein
MELVAQIAPSNITVHLLANQSGGTTVSGCADPEEADESCVGFQNQWVHTIAIEPKWRILCY